MLITSVFPRSATSIVQDYLPVQLCTLKCPFLLVIKCPSQAPMFKHLTSRWRHCFRRSWVFRRLCLATPSILLGIDFEILFPSLLIVLFFSFLPVYVEDGIRQAKFTTSCCFAFHFVMECITSGTLSHNVPFLSKVAF